MKTIRAIFKLLAFLSATAVYFLIWLAGVPFVKSSAADRWRIRNFKAWAAAAAQILRVQISVCNPSPRAPFLLVSNHLSYIDVIVFASQLDCVFVAKSEVSSWPIVGFFSRRARTIFVDRNQKRDLRTTSTKIDGAIKSGAGVVLFAEGTSSAGATVLPFRSSLLDLAVRKQLPVHYASISYVVPDDEAAAEQSVCWWGNMTFPGHFFRFLQLQGVVAKVTFGMEPMIASDRRVLATELRAAVAAQFIRTARAI